MIKILICDDELQERSFIEKKTKECLKHTRLEISSVESGKELFQKVDINEIDILLLDIDMKGMDGLEVAQRLRRDFEDVILIFVTNHAEYVFDALQYQPFRYIRKSFLDGELPVALNAAIEKLHMQQEQYVYIKNKNGEIRLDVSRVCYFELEARKIHAYSMNDKTVFYCSVKQLEQYLQGLDTEFVKIHSGCLVNPCFVEQIENDVVIMKNEKKLVMSRRNMKSVKEKIYFYWGNFI